MYTKPIFFLRYPVWLQKIFFFLLFLLATLAEYKAEMSYRKVLKQAKVLSQNLLVLIQPDG